MVANDPNARCVQRILLAEDDEDMRRFLVRALTKAGYDVVSFGNGLEAYERLKEEPFTLLLTDIVMPEMDGPTLFEKLRAQRPDLKVIFISGYAEDAFRRHLAENEDFMFLQKPFDLKELAAAVKTALQG